MTAFLKSRLGIGCAAAFIVLMAFAFNRVATRRAAREKVTVVGASAITPSAAAKAGLAAPSSEAGLPDTAGTSAPAKIGHQGGRNVGVPPPSAATPGRAQGWSGPVENAAYLDAYVGLNKASREDQDRQGNRLLRRRTTRGAESVPPSEVAEPAPPAAITRASLRLAGRETRPAAAVPDGVASPDAPDPVKPPARAADAPAGSPTRMVPRRFNPYGRVIRCELVFTIDSTNEQTPLVGLVMEPVYNNGMLVIPAGAELHGMARPDRVRDRLFSGTEWVLVFPREGDRPNGRQLNVRGVALQREDPRGTGLSWGLTDGSYGLEGRVIRSHDQADIKRFLATFLAAGAVTLQERETRGRGSGGNIRNTPQNAALQGVAVNLERYAEAITAEIEAHGVFIRVPAGHQFYFYPTQIIDADAAGVSADVATVK